MIYEYLHFSIDLDERCDGDVDCLDKSDEIDCTKIFFGPDYSRIIPRSKKGNVFTNSRHPGIFITSHLTFLKKGGIFKKL